MSPQPQPKSTISTGINTLTVIPAYVVRKLFPEDNILAQPYILDDDWLIVHATKRMQNVLVERAHLQDCTSHDGRLVLHPEVTQGFLSGSIPYVRIAKEAQSKVNDAGIIVEVVNDPLQAAKLISPKVSEQGRQLN